jgi:pimeloyl-ACP methyl ester carboxylesterase
MKTVGSLALLAAASSVSFAPGVSAEIAERQLVLAGKNLHYLEAGARGGTTVLLLHGARYSSETWRTLGTIDELVGAGYYVVAVDLPGYGRSQTVDVDRKVLLVEIMDALTIDEAVVVSPSMSGAFSFPLVIHATDRVAGFVPIAPGAIDENLRTLRKVSVPMLVVWGEKDEIIPLEKSDDLTAAIADSRRVILKGAGHACYLDSPDEFHRELLAFVASLL